MTRIGPHLRDRIVEALEKPDSFATIARRFGVSPSTVRGIAADNGFTAIGRRPDD